MKRNIKVIDKIFEVEFTINSNRNKIIDNDEKTLIDYIFDGYREGKTIKEIVELFKMKNR